VCLFVIITPGANGAITKTPSNTVGLATDRFVLECSADSIPNSIQWAYASQRVTNSKCVLHDVFLDKFDITYNNKTTDCHLVVQGSSAADRLSGPYTCRDDNVATDYEAVIIVLSKQS